MRHSEQEETERKKTVPDAFRKTSTCKTAEKKTTLKRQNIKERNKQIEQETEKTVYCVDKDFAVYDGERYIIVKPYDGYRISFTSINKHPLLGTQYFDLTLNQDSFEKEIMSARTVAFVEELEMLKKLGLGKGGNLENCVVFDKDKILSQPRFDNELIRHKILDVIGDLYLLGSIKAHVICVTTGHAFNSAVAKQIQLYREGK